MTKDKGETVFEAFRAGEANQASKIGMGGVDKKGREKE